MTNIAFDGKRLFILILSLAAYALFFLWQPYIAITLLVLTLIIFIHEFGHYFFLRRDHINVKKFCIGFGKDEWAIWSKQLKNGTKFMIKPILLGGYVLPDEKAVEAARPWSKFKYFLGGVLFNALSAFIVLAVFLYAQGAAPHLAEMSNNPLFRLCDDLTHGVPSRLQPLVCAFCLAFGLWLGTPYLIVWTFLSVGTQALAGPIGVISAGIPTEVIAAAGAAAASGAPAAAGAAAASGAPAAVALTAPVLAAIAIHYLVYFIFISIALAGFNFLPFYPLDGGHICELAIVKIFGRHAPAVIRCYRWVSLACILGLFCLAIGLDVWRLFTG